MFYSAGWQLLEEHIDQNNTGGFSVERIAQQFWGIRYIDDAVARRLDTNADGTWDDTYFHITDVQFSSGAMIDDTSKLIERVEYDAYGKARHQYPEDLDGDGDVDTADQTLFNNSYNGVGIPYSIGHANYNVDADFDRDGDVDLGDSSRFTAANPTSALASGQISDPSGPDNVIGYDGYVFNGVQNLYTVRFRTYQPGTGRWLERDPAGYIDSTNLLQYGHSRPVGFFDYLGLAPQDGLSKIKRELWIVWVIQILTVARSFLNY